MNCTDCKKQIVDVLDRAATLDAYPELRHHLNHCEDCRQYYEEMMATAHWLTTGRMPGPQETREVWKAKIAGPSSSKRGGFPAGKEVSEMGNTEPQHVPSSRRALPRCSWRNIAASVAIFTAGLAVGWSQFFSQPATAEPFSLQQALNRVEHVGNYQMMLSVRSNPNENFETLDPTMDFVPLHMTYLTQNDSAFWRLEKVGGRTSVWNGKEQYLWIPQAVYYITSAKNQLDGNLAQWLNPYQLLSAQQLAIHTKKKVDSSVEIKEGMAIMTLRFDQDFTDLDALFKDQPNSMRQLIIENQCSLKDGLLRSIRIWVVQDGKQTEVLKTQRIDYNLAIDRPTVTRLPQGAKWIDLRQDPTLVDNCHRLLKLQKETPTAAAERVIQAILTGDTQMAKEALAFYPMDLLVEKMKNCHADHFSAPKTDQSYPGCFVFFKLTYPDGRTATQHIALRKDNPQGIWVVDGGL